MKSISVLLTAFAANCAVATAHHPLGSLHARDGAMQIPTISKPIFNQPTYQGCFSDSGDLKLNTTRKNTNTMMDFGHGPELDSGVTSGLCYKWCAKDLEKNVFALSAGSQCWCGDDYPVNSSMVSIKNCNIPCSGYGLEYCGGSKAWMVYNTGNDLTVTNLPEVSSTTAAPSSTAPPKTSSSTSSTVSEPTPEITESTLPQEPEKKGKSNTAGIVAGTVVSVVVVLSAVGGVFLYMRRKRNKEIEDEHRRNAAVNAFIGKPPSTSDGMSMADARLDPVLVQRRLSDGSIADNQDYSRRILRVTNA
ncbi:WSC domain-containing protein [Pseudoneurospora amorphoporcata]|uniref:WSC domain-containing protein n=1 Tax=Pseudoneurospora amorphoporcata TaxID=241081 RepID=A0AAN6SCL0_9PEZI|nr:WSC domain-containing protein [Pseudoneurospora amorphoporcata]